MYDDAISRTLKKRCVEIFQLNCARYLREMKSLSFTEFNDGIFSRMVEKCLCLQLVICPAHASPSGLDNQSSLETRR